MTQYDGFEQVFSGALSSEEMPAADFTARVMAQVVKTPQVKDGSSRRTWKIVLTAAACLAVVVIAVPVLFFGTMRAGSAAPKSADCAAPAAAEDCAEEEVANDFVFMTETPTESMTAENGAIKEKSDADSGEGYEEVCVSNTDLCQQVREILGEMGLVSDSGYYMLTAEQAAALHEAMPELKLPTGAFALVLEG